MCSAGIRPRGLPGLRGWRPVRCIVASVITELVKWSGEVTLSLLCLLCPTLRRFPYGAGCRSVRRAARSAQRTAHRHQLLSELRVSAQHGCREGQVGHQHNNGRRRVQQVDGTDSVREGEGVRSDGGPRPARHQRALEGKAVRDDPFKVKPRKVSAVGRS